MLPSRHILPSRDRKGAVSPFDMSSPGVTDPNKKKLEELARLGWYHSMELPDGRVIPGFQSLDVLRNRIAQFPVPADLRGKRALDIGAWDGWFTFELERRGARVMAVDSTAFERFRVARDLLGSQAEYRIDDVCRLSPAKIGYFDIVSAPRARPRLPSAPAWSRPRARARPTTTSAG